MKALVQRVTKASVSVSGEVIGEIRHGLVVLVGVARGDTERDAIYLADKIAAKFWSSASLLFLLIRGRGDGPVLRRQHRRSKLRLWSTFLLTESVVLD